MPNSASTENGGEARLFRKVDDPMSLFNILESRLPYSCCIVNLLLAYDRFKDKFKAYTYNQGPTQDANVESSANEMLNGEFGADNASNLWILINYKREDWHNCILLSPPTPTVTDVSPELKHALEYSNIFEWSDPFVFLNIDPAISDFIINMNLRKFGNVLKIFPCYLFYINPEKAANLEVNVDPNVTVAPMDIAKGTEFLTKNWDYTYPETSDYIMNSASKHVSAAVYLPNGEIACAAFMAPYGNICTLVTHKDHRRKGYASLVMRYIIRESGKQGFHPSWETGITNYAGVGFHTSIDPAIEIIAKVDYVCHNAL